MSGDPFLLRSGGTPVRLTPTPFPLELDLQRLLAEHPSLLPSADRSREARWLLVTQEWPIDAAGTSFWLDHLFLDGDGVPTLVECKLAKNPQHRREVIGQALDYASWFALEGSDAIRRYLVARLGDGADEAVRSAFEAEDGDFDVEAYWQRVDAQLTQRRMRLVFAGDNISPLVRRVAEFLNRELRNVEVLAVEYSVWEDQGTRILVPTVYGETIESQTKHEAVTPGRQWTNEEWFGEFQTLHGQSTADGLRQLVSAWREMEADGYRAVANPGVGKNVAFHMYLEDSRGRWAPAIRVTNSWLVVPTNHLETRRAWISQEASSKYLSALGSAVNEQIDPSDRSGRFRLSLESLANEEKVAALSSALRNWATELKRVWTQQDAPQSTS